MINMSYDVRPYTRCRVSRGVAESHCKWRTDGGSAIVVRHAGVLPRNCQLTIEQLIYAKVQATAGQNDHAWKRRTLALIETNPRQVTESSAQALFQAAAYPEAIAAAAAVCARAPDSATNGA
jgi:hypothetical protein